MQAKVKLEDVFDHFIFSVLKADLDYDVFLEKVHDSVLHPGDARLELDRGVDFSLENFLALSHELEEG